MAWISARPVSRPMGRAPDLHSLSPLYRAGLCEAVNMAPGASRLPAAKYRRSVEARPRSTTATPSDRTPSAKACDSSTPDSRMSRATRILGPPVNRATAMPMARNWSAFNSSGTTPRTSYALKTEERLVMAGPS